MATSFALNEKTDINNNILVFGKHFKNAMAEISPAFGTDNLELYHHTTLADNPLTANKSISVLLYGTHNSGKTNMAVDFAIKSEIPYIKMITADMLISMTEFQITNKINNIFCDAQKSQSAIIILDSIERIIQYTAIGPRFSNPILQTILALIKKPVPRTHKLIIIGTININYEMFNLHCIFNEIKKLN